MNAKETPVTVLGLGLMGSALARAFLKNNHPTTVWNRTAQKAENLAAEGAENAPLDEAIAASDTIVICVRDYAAVHELLDPARDRLAGKTLINLTSGLPEDARAMAAWAADASIHYLDGCVMAVPPMVGQPHTLLFHGGSHQAFTANEPLLKALGGNNVYLGPDAATPVLHDLALLTVLWGGMASALHGFALLASENIPASTLLPYLEPWITQGLLASVRGAAHAVDTGDYTTPVSTAELNATGLAKLVKASEARGIRPDLMTPLRDLLQERVEAGHGDEAFSTVYEALRDQPSSV